MDKNRMTTDDKFLANMKKKHDTKEVDKVKVKPATMEGIMKNYAQVPDKLNMVGSPDIPSAKKQKSGENQLQTGPGKNILKSTMDKEY